MMTIRMMILVVAAVLSFGLSAELAQAGSFLQKGELAEHYFGADAPWFEQNIPFFEIDDPDIEQVYYYRWKLYRAHIREIGAEGTTVLEFLDDVPWARHPYTDLNDSSSFHILEGRWLRNSAIVGSLIDHLYSGGGNDRHFSESIAAATEASTRVTGDPAPGLRHLDTMRYIFNQWDDHFDRQRNLYWVEPLADATEYTISSIDASGAGFTDRPAKEDVKNGFTQGFAFRPTINSYQYGNALAIARFARLAGLPDVAEDYQRRADRIRAATLDQLWNPDLAHFVDRYQRSTPTVTEGNFVRGRELEGYLPWFFELPPQGDDRVTQPYAAAWRHVLSDSELAGPYGLRTVEPSYPRYMTQYRYDAASGKPECQWNGPSWPFQTSQVLTALANLLDDYPRAEITRADYLSLLRQYTRQHFLADGHPDLQEDYNPDTGKPIVGLARSHHYSHSTYVDLILSGLVGIRPRADDVLEVAPLLPENAPATKSIRYFAVEGVRYHGHELSVLYDRDGSRYGSGAGLSIFLDGTRVRGPVPAERTVIDLPATGGDPVSGIAMPEDYAVNVGTPDGPVATASSSLPSAGAEQAIDGRLWFFPENPNGWTPAVADGQSWLSIDLRRRRTLGSVELYFFADDAGFRAPSGYRLQYETDGGWRDIADQRRSPSLPLANGLNRITFPAVGAQKLRLSFTNPPAPAQLRLIEVKAFAPAAK
jgi:hypothetical protein